MTINSLPASLSVSLHPTLDRANSDVVLDRGRRARQPSVLYDVRWMVRYSVLVATRRRGGITTRCAGPVRHRAARRYDAWYVDGFEVARRPSRPRVLTQHIPIIL